MNLDVNLEVPLLCTRLTPMTRYDWNYTTTPQVNLNDRVLPFPRGIGLGGSTAVNCLVYTRGSRDDIDMWAKLSGDKSWGWDAMLPYFTKGEKFNLPVDGRDVSGQYDPSAHGTKGFIGVSVPGAPRGIDDRVMATTKELPEEFPFQKDMNAGNQVGVGWVQALIDRGVRSSAKDYLPAGILKRPNLDVLLHTRASHVLETSRGSRDFRKIVLHNVQKNTNRTLTARKEVLLAAGTLSTPHILMLSGIGDTKELAAHNIPTLVNLPSVGKNLTDHVGLGVRWRVNSTKTYDTVARTPELFDALFEEWKVNKTGMMVDTSENHMAFLRLPDDSPILKEFGDPSPGKNTGHIEFLFQNGLYSRTPEGNFLSVPVANVSPLSRGAVSLSSSAPFAAPLINPGLLAAPVDIHILRHAIRSARRFISARAWDGYILEPLLTAETDEELNAFIRENAVSFFHPVGTSAMSPKGAKWGVVDPDLKVKGTKGLRVVDVGVAPSLPAAHTSAPAYAIGERAADIIKKRDRKSVV